MKAPHQVGAGDGCTPDSAGCCGCTVTARCPGCPHAGLLTETADYDEPGSWGRASRGWPQVRGDVAHAMYVFANCVQSVPYGSYVLIAERGRYGAKESVLRVHAEHLEKLKADFVRAGSPGASTSIERREKYGRRNQFGNREAAPLWTAT